MTDICECVKKNLKSDAVSYNTTASSVPAYIKSVYGSIYVKGKFSSFFDSDFFANFSTCGQYKKIKKSVLAEIKEMQNVLFVGNANASFMQEIIKKIGKDAAFDIVEAVPVQAELAKNKLKQYPNAKIITDDIEFYYPKKSRKRVKYDLVIAYFLLHEMPDCKKSRVIESLISLTTRSGKILFVDYDVPHKCNVPAHIVKWLNFLIEPFAESLQTKGLESFVAEPEKYLWDKENFLAGMYQRTTIKRKR